MTRVLIAGGGTGGHIYPAISIATEIRRQNPGAEILFVGTKRGLEADLVPRAGFSLRTINIYGFQRRMSWRNVENIWNTVCSLWKSKKILNDFRPDVVLGTGGYVCGPVLLMAALSGIPTVIQEQNSFPGVTNRILSRFVQVIALGYEDAAFRFSSSNARFVITGNPVRDEFIKADKDRSYEVFGFSRERLTILIAGGSQGARSINAAAIELHRRFVGNQRVQLIHITGTADFEELTEKLRREELLLNDPAHGRLVVPYLHNMAEAMAIADVAISRAGAIALSEIMLRGIPSILIPYPFAAENHQEFNARYLVEKGAAILIRDKDLTGENLCAAVESITCDSETRRKMGEECRKLGRPKAVEEIVSLVMALTVR
jgi:UDP-N-acetylglucosamine--N-acetylmuramyl-(pentapeptide) pyrophosphoryl-undecaprenol N-acetylglucosamine transferase